MDRFTEAYFECALWSSLDDDGTPFDAIAGDFSPETAAQMEADCADFQTANAELLQAAYEDFDFNDARAGHDFWLTRNHHGAGFWDRGLGEIGSRLTEAALAYGECDLYVGDDCKIYAM